MSDLKSKVLIIDDSQVDRELLKGVLLRKGFDVVALETANNIMETISNEKPDLVLLDVMMKEFDGNQALSLIRGTYGPIDLPVIMVTSKNDDQDILESFNKGANDYITKPLRIEVALRRIQTQLMLSIQARSMVKTKEIETIHSMIATYNHEINNPLAIAAGNLDILKAQNDRVIKSVQEAIGRIAQVVRNTNNILSKTTFEYDKYSDNINILKINKSEN